MWYLPEGQNPNKHPMMQVEYPWKISDVFIEGYIEITQEQLDELLLIDRSAYLADMKPPAEVTNQQLRQALILKAFTESKPQLHPEAITAFLKSLPEPTKSIALNFWDYSNMMQRSNATLAQLSPMLGLSSEEVDNIFKHAHTLN